MKYKIDQIVIIKRKTKVCFYIQDEKVRLVCLLSVFETKNVFFLNMT